MLGRRLVLANCNGQVGTKRPKRVVSESQYDDALSSTVSENFHHSSRSD